jgi:hypothetical protein
VFGSTPNGLSKIMLRKTATIHIHHICIKIKLFLRVFFVGYKAKTKILVTVTQSVTNVPQMNNTSTSGRNGTPNGLSKIMLRKTATIHIHHICIKIKLFLRVFFVG